MRDSAIQWCDGTVNASSGCVGCELARPSLPEDDRVCWAYQLQVARLSQSLPALYASNFFEVREISGRITKAAGWSDLRGKRREAKPWIPPQYPRLIFLSDMADLLSPGISFEYIRDEVLTHITSSRGSRHIWLWLTKQAKRMVELSDWMKGAGLPWPSNLWPGVSLTTAASAWRIDYLMRVPARHHFVSYEPAWEWIPIFERATFPDWVIVGGQSGRGAARRPFDVTIAARLLSERKKHGTAVFVKQMGRTTAGLPGSTAVREWIDTHGGDWNEWPDEFRVREFPKLA